MKIYGTVNNEPKAFEYKLDSMTSQFNGNVVLGLNPQAFEQSVGTLKLELNPAEAIHLVSLLCNTLTSLGVGK